METVNALTLRQSLGRILKRLQKQGAPILIEKNRQPAAVLISLADYQARFVDREADDARKQIVQRLRSANLHWRTPTSAEAEIRKLRQG